MRSKHATPAKLAPLELDPVRCRATWLDEPELVFAVGRRHCDPKTGIPLYGPRSFGTTRHKREVHVGYSNPEFVEILDNGVRPGEKVIIAGQTALQNGDPIRVQ